MIAPPFSARYFGWLISSKAISANMRERCGLQGGSKRLRRSRRHTREQIVDARQWCVSRARLPASCPGEGEQVSEPRAAGYPETRRREYDRLWLVRNREEGQAILAAAQFRNPREVVLDQPRNSRSRVWLHLGRVGGSRLRHFRCRHVAGIGAGSGSSGSCLPLVNGAPGYPGQVPWRAVPFPHLALCGPAKMIDRNGLSLSATTLGRSHSARNLRPRVSLPSQVLEQIDMSPQSPIEGNPSQWCVRPWQGS